MPMRKVAKNRDRRIPRPHCHTDSQRIENEADVTWVLDSSPKPDDRQAHRLN